MQAIAIILVLGVTAQWLAWRLRVPSILLLLAFGFLAGPVTHKLDPDRLLGSALQPMVAVAVALILFEGGMSLKRSELVLVGGVVRNLATIGALLTGVITAFSVHFIMHLGWELSSLLGAILLVTGPTVIGPLLRHVRPMGQLGPILKWEGILIDPIGAMVAVLVFEAVQYSAIRHATPVLLNEAFKTLGVGVGLGAAFAGAMVLLFRRHWVPDHLHNPLSLSIVVAAFVISNLVQPESGLFTVTVMGIAIANQKSVVVQHIAEFKETLSVLLVSSLFIVLSARMHISQVREVGWRGLILVGVLIALARPISVYFSTIGCGLTWQQRLFLAAMAPRGIVAAAVASVFALRLSDANVAGAQLMVPIAFAVIISTVLVYGLGAKPFGRLLGVTWPDAQGCVIVGCHALGRAVGKALQESNCPVLLLDTNRSNVQQARLEGLPVFLSSVVSHEVFERVELGGLGRMLAMTSNDEVNSLAALNFARIFGRSEVFQLGMTSENGKHVGEVTRELRGRPLFLEGATYGKLINLIDAGGRIRKTRLTENFGYEQFRSVHGPDAMPLFLITAAGEVNLLAADEPDALTGTLAGQTLVHLSADSPESTTAREHIHQNAAISRSAT